MLIKDISPSKTIAEFIQFFRIVHLVPTEDILHFSKYYIPKPEMVLHAVIRGATKIKLTLNPSAELSYNCFLAGQQTTPFILNSSGELLNFQIVFKPTAFTKIAGIPSSEFACQFTDAALIFGSSVFEYFEQLQFAASYAEMEAIAEKFVLKLIQKSGAEKTQIDNIFSRSYQSGTINSIAQLAREAYLSEKQFKRVFYNSVGINPKTYFKLFRFIHAYNTKNAKSHWDWLRIAIECNYYDYQHLSKDYLLFTKYTPVEFHQQIEPRSPEVQLGLSKQIYNDRFLQLL
jgi:AraC-like DNA-binding protein